jgi:hypothetical protein
LIFTGDWSTDESNLQKTGQTDGDNDSLSLNCTSPIPLHWRKSVLKGLILIDQPDTPTMFKNPGYVKRSLDESQVGSVCRKERLG